jgi:phosphocarrier protein
MIEKDVEIVNERGMHARAASKFVHLASGFSARIKIAKGGVEVDGKSILGLLLLQAAKGTNIRLIIDGPDEEEAWKQLHEMISSRFGEPN